MTWLRGRDISTKVTVINLFVVDQKQFGTNLLTNSVNGNIK